MNMIPEELLKLKDDENAAFQAKLTPGIPTDRFLGIKIPVIRKFAAQIKDEPETELFMQSVPHYYYDENMLHSILIEQCSNFEKTLIYLEKFLPYVDNWATCDTLRPKSFKKHKNEILPFIEKWMASPETYTCRFGTDMLMTHFLDEDFKAEYLDLPCKIKSEEYYVNMMIAWYYATALAKQWNSTISYLEKRKLSDWIHKKTIQKAIESYRITEDQKNYLRSLK